MEDRQRRQKRVRGPHARIEAPRVDDVQGARPTRAGHGGSQTRVETLRNDSGAPFEFGRILRHDAVCRLLVHEHDARGRGHDVVFHAGPDAALPGRTLDVGAVDPRIREVRDPREPGFPMQPQTDQMIGPGLGERHEQISGLRRECPARRLLRAEHEPLFRRRNP